MGAENEELRQMVRKRMNAYADEVAKGSCRDYPEYQHYVGVIRGLAEAERDLLDLRERAERAEQ